MFPLLIVKPPIYCYYARRTQLRTQGGGTSGTSRGVMWYNQFPSGSILSNACSLSPCNSVLLGAALSVLAYRSDAFVCIRFNV